MENRTNELSEEIKQFLVANKDIISLSPNGTSIIINNTGISFSFYASVSIQNLKKFTNQEIAACNGRGFNIRLIS